MDPKKVAVVDHDGSYIMVDPWNMGACCAHCLRPSYAFVPHVFCLGGCRARICLTCCEQKLCKGCAEETRDGP